WPYPVRTGRSIFWWPPTDLGPERTSCHQLWPVQLEGSDGGAPAWGQPNDLRSVIAPPEVLPPLLLPGIEQGNLPSCCRSRRLDSSALELVASVAGEPQVRL